MLISIALAVVCTGFGVAFFTGLALKRISAWQTMPKEEQAKIRILPLCRNISLAFFAAAALFFAAGFSPVFKAHYLWAGFVVWFVLCGLDAWYIGKSKRYLVAKTKKG